TGTDSSSASERTANYVGVCVGAITATRSARPSRSDGRSGCCFRPENRYTTHSGSDAASESPRQSKRYWETTGPLRAPDPGYVGTPSCAATCTATVSGVSETRNQQTRNPPPPWSADSSPGLPPIEEPQTGFGDAPTLAWPLIPYAPAAPY